MRQTNEIIYKDFDFRFIAHPVTGKLIVRKNAESIKQALKLLILTNYYERPYRSKYGGNISAFNFENYTGITQQNIVHSIKTAIENFEPRVELIDVRFGGNPDRNELAVTIIFRPINATVTESLSINLERVR